MALHLALIAQLFAVLILVNGLSWELVRLLPKKYLTMRWLLATRPDKLDGCVNAVKNWNLIILVNPTVLVDVSLR